MNLRQGSTWTPIRTVKIIGLDGVIDPDLQTPTGWLFRARSGRLSFSDYAAGTDSATGTPYLVQEVRRHVGAVVPHNSVEIGMEANRLEKSLVS